MEKINENTTITQFDLSFIIEELSNIQTALTLQEMAKKLAYKKNASQLSQKVKKYDPYCKFEIGDLVYKEYNEPLTVSTKGAELFKGAVVLSVIQKITYEGFDCQMLEVDYSGGGLFRKHIDYMKKTHTQVLLPSSLEGKTQEPEILKKEKDPRLNQLPMTEKDLKTLEKNLGLALSKSKRFFCWQNLWQLKEKLLSLPDSNIREMQTFLSEKRQSASTKELVTRFLHVQPSDENFFLHCLSLNYILENNYKKSFIFVSSADMGRWFLKEMFVSYLKGIPLSAETISLPALETMKKTTSGSSQSPLKVYLSLREVLSGGVKIPKALLKEFSDSREYTFLDVESGKEFVTYYYPSNGIFLGLNEFYRKNNVPQGASLTLEKYGSEKIKCTLKKSKRPLSIPVISYDAKKDKFSMEREETTTFALPNKIIFLERETLQNLLSLYNKRNSLDLRELVILMFKNFGLQGEALSLHYQRLFHLVDVLRHTSMEDIEKTLLLFPEFTSSEKKKGLFLYQEKVKTEEEVHPKEAFEALEKISVQHPPAETEEEDLPAIGTVGEIETPKIVLKEGKRIHEPVPRAEEKRIPDVEKKAVLPPIAKTEGEIPRAKPEEKHPPIAKRPKEPKKKKQKAKMEGERELRRKRGEKKIIEERIEIEESELEALFAIKAEKKKEIEEEKIESTTKKTKEAYMPTENQQALSGIFGEKLKSALSQKKDDKPPPEKTSSKKKETKKAKKDNKS